MNGGFLCFYIYFILFYLRDVFVCGRGMGVSGTYILGAFLETKVSERFYNFIFFIFFSFKGLFCVWNGVGCWEGVGSWCDTHLHSGRPSLRPRLVNFFNFVFS